MPTSVRLRGRGGGVPVPPTFTSPATFVALAENNIDFTVTTAESCTYAITGGADQAQFALNGAVLTLVAQAYVAAGNNDRVVIVTATSTVTGLTRAQTITAVVTDIATVKLVPTSQWTGTAGSGYGGANPAAPTDPTRTGAKMICRLLRPPAVAFSDDYTLIVSAASFDGVETVTFYCEGQEVEVLAPKWWPITKPDDTTLYVYGYGIQFDHVAIQAFGVAESAMNVYVKATPPTGSTIQERVIGPYLYYARDAGVGAGCVYDFEVYVDPLGTPSPGIRYTTIVGALKYCSQNSKLRPHVVLERTTRYSTDGNITPYPHTGHMWWTIEAASGVTAQLGNWDASTAPYTTSWFCDNICFRGAGVVLELAAMAPRTGNMWQGQTGSTNSLWLDGCEVTGGTYVGSGYAGGTGSGQEIRYYGLAQNGYFFRRQSSGDPFNFYFTHLNIHDMPGYMLDSSNLILDCDVARCSGSAIENNFGAIQGLRVTEMGGYQSGERSFNEVFTLAYTGAATLAQFNKPSANGRDDISGTPYPITFWEDGVEVGSLTVVDPGTSTYTTMQDLADYANTLTGWTATVTGTADDLAWSANYVSVADMVPSAGVGTVGESASPYSKRTITSTPLSMCRVADVHANALTWDGATLAQNVSVEFVEGYNIVGAANMGAGTVKDFVIRWCTLQDTSEAFQTANPTQDPAAGAQASIYSGTNSHFIVDAAVYEGPGQNALTQSTATFDAKSVIKNSVYEAFSVNGAGKPAFTGNVFRTGSLPSGSDATSKALANGYTESQLFADPLAAVPDFTPISSQLTLTTGKYAGANVPTAKSTSYNRGWNLGSLDNSL